MPVSLSSIMSAANAGLAAQQAEVNSELARAVFAVHAQRATGTGHIAHTFKLDSKFRLVYVRCHFTGTATLAAMTISLDSGAGSAYDTVLNSIAQAGVARDVNLRIGAEELQEPSGWTFESTDEVAIAWTNPSPGSITWGLEVGMALAS